MGDFSHIALVNGVFNREVMLFLERAAELKLPLDFASIRSYIDKWTWPLHLGKKAKDAFGPKREKASKAKGEFKAGASEILSCYLVLRELVRKCVPRDRLQAETRSFLALCKVLDGYLVTQSQQEPLQWQAAIQQFYQLHLAAYPTIVGKPKHHALMHCDEQRRRKGFYLSCLTHERKHKVLKRFATHQTRLDGFEKSMAVDLLNAQVRGLPEALRRGTFLERPREERGALAEQLGAARLMVARTASCNGTRTSSGDFAWLKETPPRLVKVLLHMDASPKPVGSSGFVALAENYTGDASGVYTRGGQVLLPIERLACAAIWTTSGPGVRPLLHAGQEYFR